MKFEELANAAQAEAVIELSGAPEIGRLYGVSISDGTSEKSFAIEVSAGGYKVLVNGLNVDLVDVDGAVTLEKIRNALIDVVEADSFARSTVSVEASYPVGEIKVVGLDANINSSVTSLNDDTSSIESVGVEEHYPWDGCQPSEIKT